jgi:hypothetical protein
MISDGAFIRPGETTISSLDAAGIRNMIRLLGPANAKIASLKAEPVVDDKIVKKLEQEGRFK